MAMCLSTKVLQTHLKCLKCLKCPFPPFDLLYWRSSQSYSTAKYMKYYAVLDVPLSSDQESVRRAFLRLVKKFHPDSGTKEANKEKFHEIETAYRKLQEKFASERWNVNEGLGEYGLYYEEKTDKEIDIKHTAPQHRQYLTYDGYGFGSPQQRQKQYQKKRVLTAVENVYNHRMSKVSHGESALAIKDKTEAKKIKTRSEMDRLVEDLIQESMARGEFNNLSGSGKPLSQGNVNPYVDFVTHKMNQVLIDNGFTPEWITLQKEITNKIKELQIFLADKRTLLGPEPLTEKEEAQWKSILKDLEKDVTILNKMIDKFNLQVPILEKQKVFFRLNKEAAKVISSGKTKYDVPPPALAQSTRSTEKEDELTLTGLLEILLFPQQK